MALVPSINQNAANITFNSIIYGAEPSVLTPVSLASGFAYTAMGSLIGTSLASPGSSYFLFDETDATQQLYGITYDEWFNSVAFAGSQAPFTFTGNIATTAGSIYVPTVGNIAGSNGLNPYLATSVITGVSVNANNLTIGSAVRGTGLPANSTILAILSATVILVSGNVTATTSAVSITNYATAQPDGLVNVATVQGNTTQWVQSYLVGVNGAADITNYITANPNLARSFTRWSGAQSIPVVSFNFIG